MLGASLMLSGGAFVATAGPASAAAGGVNVCNTFVATADATAAPPTISGTFSNCHQQGTGAVSGVFDITGGPSPGSVLWATGHATSVFSLVLLGLDFSGGPCPPGDIAAFVEIDVGGGPYATPPAAAGGGTLCADISGGLANIAISNFGPITI
jgi:hypothetical protein